MPRLRSVLLDADAISVSALKRIREWMPSGAVQLHVTTNGSGFEWTGCLDLATAERLSSYLTLAIMEARGEAGDE